MSFILEVVRWIADPAHWAGTDGISHRLVEHIELSALATAVALILAAPPGIALGHVRRGGVVAVGVINIGRALPAFALIAIALPISIRLGLGLGFWPTFAGLVVLALPPIFTTSYTAVRDVDRGAVQAASGMGLTAREIVLGVEIPLAAPVILAAVRVTVVQVVATAPLGALFGWGGLGRFIIDGFAVRDLAMAAAGAALVAVLALATDAAFGLAERVLLPHGVRRLRRAEAAAIVGRAA
jgi:osmoprotectant transport system permease protein